MNSLNSSVTSVLTSLANAPQLQSVPADISDLKKEFGQFGSRLTDVETQVNSASDKLRNMHKEIKNLPDNSQNAALNDEVLNQIRAKLDNKVTNETLKLNMKIQSATGNFQILGTNLTEQLQRLEMREEKSWKLMEQMSNDLQNISAKASSNELVSRENKATIVKIKEDIENLQESNQKTSTNP